MKHTNTLATLAILASFAIIQACTPRTTKKVTSQEMPATYSGGIQGIIASNCQGCHSGGKPAAKLDLTTYENVKAITESGTLGSRINDHNNPMPPKGVMSESYRDAFARWADAGYPK